MTSMMKPKLDAQIRIFLAEFEKAILVRDFESIEPFFAADVTSYGTRTLANFGREELREKQWSKIWGNCLAWSITSIDSIVITDEMALATYRWLRINQDSSETGGRASLVFNLQPSLQVIHSHFSEF